MGLAKIKSADLIISHCRERGLPVPLREALVVPWRDWRFDLCWPHPHLIAVEIQGGTFAGGRHSRGPALRGEYEKLAAAVIRGWRVLLMMPEQVKPGKGLRWIEELLKTPR